MPSPSHHVDSGALTAASCPACHATASTQIGGQAPAFDTWLHGRNFYQPAYVVRSCDSCGLYFKAPTLPPGELAAYYERLDSAAFDYDGDFPTDRIVIDRLKSLPDGSRVLDFGCSTGRMLRSQTSRLQCIGVEPNHIAAEAARQRGIAIVSEAELWQSRASFDAIVLADVYEHLLDPLPVMQRLSQRLADGGWMVMVSGNADAISDRERLAEFWYFRLPGHLSMLTARHLRWLAAQLDLTLAGLYRCSHYRPSLADAVRQYAQAFAYRQFRSAPRGVAARVMRRLPGLKSAERWTAAPAFTCGADHVVAFLHHHQPGV